jgi:hypothetical protein
MGCDFEFNNQNVLRDAVPFLLSKPVKDRIDYVTCTSENLPAASFLLE